MTIAAKHMDPIVGVDTHIIMIPTPGGPVPTPLPHPYVGMVMDPFDYAPVIGATVFINGMPRAQAGTGGMAVPPHIPMGGPFGPPIASNESEMFMGSATVAIDGDAQSFLAHPVISCQSIGMPAPLRPKGQPPKSLVLPTSAVLSVPSGPPVMIGGPPTISLMVLGFRAGFAALGKIGKGLRKLQRADGLVGNAMRAVTKKARKAGDAVADALKLGAKGRNRVNKAICTVTGHPVDVATGKVLTDKVDLELPGPIPFKWERTWYSTSTYNGPLGHGWHHSYDAALYVRDDVVLYRAEDGRLVSFPPLAEGQESFDRTERLTLLRDAEGYAIRTIERMLFRFRDVGRPDGEYALSSIESPVGHRIALRYDSRGRLVEILDSAGRSLRFAYDKHGRITTMSAPHPDEDGMRFTVSRYGYDRDGNLTTVTDALGQVASYGYHRHLLVKETDRNGLSFYFEYDGDDETARCVHTWGDGGIYDHRLSYDEPGVTTVEDGLGHRTLYRHFGGRVVQSEDPLGAITVTECNEHGELVEEIDALGHRSTYSYDARGNLTLATRADGSTVSTDYDALDHAVKQTDVNGGIWTWSYDPRGRVTERVDSLGRAIRLEYEGAHIARAIFPGDQVTRLHHDLQGYLTALVTPDGGRSQWEYDRLGRAVAAIDPNGNTQERTFDRAGRVMRIKTWAGEIRKLERDGEGNITHVKEPQHDVRLDHRGMGRIASVTEAGATIRFEYDAEERLIGIVNEQGHTHRLQLGPTGEVEAEIGFDGTPRHYERDLVGRLTEIRSASGIAKRYEYDAAHQVVRVTYSTGEEETYAYRADGEMVEATNASCTVRLERDPLGRIVKEHQNEHWVQIDYDSAGHRVRTGSSLGADITVDRNAVGDVESVHQTGGGFEARFERNLLGLELSRELPGSVRSRWQRDRLGRPLKQEITAHGSTVRARTYHWATGDRLRAVVDALKGTADYAYDAVGRLASASYPDGALEIRVADSVGNIFRRRDRSDCEYGPAGQLLEATDRRGRVSRYEHDDDGNLIAKHEPGGRVWRYSWGSDGTLRQVTRPDLTRVEFKYDPFGRRVEKRYRGLVTCWIWDGNVPLHEWVEGELEPAEDLGLTPLRHVDAEIQRREAELQAHLVRGPPQRGSLDAPITWIFEPETFAPLAKINGDVAYSIITDHLGTPIQVVNDTGSTVWRTDISVRGDLIGTKGDRFACPFRWPGQYEDAETGLYYNRFRYYDPEAGRYTSPDPMGLAGGLALYCYVGDPLTSYDPLGLNNVSTGAGRHHVTYRGTKGGKPYTGYASAPSDAGLTSNEIVSRRYGGNFDEFDAPPKPVYDGVGEEGKNTARGLEQHYYEEDVKAAGGESKKVANKQNPVGENNPKKKDYRVAANKHLKPPC